jgi:hypothetical protein
MVNYFQYTNTALLDKKIESGTFPFSQQLFWDAALSDINLHKHKRYIIERVLTRGFTADFYMLLKIYTTDEIKDAIRKSKSLDPKTVHFCSWYFHIPITEINVSSFYH